MGSTFINEVRAYELLKQAGLDERRLGVVRAEADVAALPFKPGDRVVVKGVAQDVWHKSDIGLVRFETFDPARIWALAQEMEAIGSAHGAWVGTLVVDLLDFRKVSGLPTEALVALRRTQDAGWTLVLGIGGLHTNAWGEQIKPLPVAPQPGHPRAGPGRFQGPLPGQDLAGRHAPGHRPSPTSSRCWPTCADCGSWRTCWTPKGPNCSR